MPTGILRDAKATPGWWQQAGCLGLYLLRTCGEEGGGVFSLFGSPGPGPPAVATLSIQSVPQAWQPPGDPATWVRLCPPGSQAGTFLQAGSPPGWQSRPSGGGPLQEGRSVSCPSTPGGLEFSLCPLSLQEGPRTHPKQGHCSQLLLS